MLRMPSALDVVTDTLCVARLVRLITEDKIAEPLRDAMVTSGDDRLAYLATCPYCVSVWAGAAVASGLMPRRLRYALALSEAATGFRKALDALPTRW